MLSIRSILLVGLPLITLGIARNQADEADFEADAVAKWEEIIQQLPGESLKAALAGHLKPKYREGVFEHGRDAIDAVRSDDPELASKLVDLAKQDAIVKDHLRRRQNDNSTATTTSPVIVTDASTTAVSFTTQTTVVTTTEQRTSATTIPVVTSVVASSTVSADESITEPTVTAAPSSAENTQTGVLIPVEVTTTNNNGGTVVQTTEAFQNEAPTSVAVTVTTTNEQGQTVTTSSMAPAAVVTSVNEQGSTITTASPLQAVSVASGGRVISSVPSAVTTNDGDGSEVVLSSPTPGGVYTTSDSGGRVVTVTYQPGGGTVSRLRLQTTTLPNGMRSTITSFAEVGQATGDSAPGATGGANPSPSDRPGLQSGAAIPSSWYAAEFAVMVGAAIGVAALVL